MEKCYREIQVRGQIAGLNILELFVLIAIPVILFPLFTLLNWHALIILAIELVLYLVFRFAAALSNFDYGLASFVFSKFIWPKKLAAYPLDETRYIKNDQS